MWQKRIGTGWKAKTRYITKPDEHPTEAAWFPDTVFHLVKSGSMCGKSIGGAMKMRAPTEADSVRLGFDLSKCKRISDKVEVWEYSVCPIGANNNSVVEAITKSQISIEESLLQSEFPEVYEAVKNLITDQKNKELMVINGFKTVNQVQLENAAAVKDIETKLLGKLPGIVDNVYKRLLGLVE
jgi:hypothetical protein